MCVYIYIERERIKHCSNARMNRTAYTSQQQHLEQTMNTSWSCDFVPPPMFSLPAPTPEFHPECHQNSSGISPEFTGISA